MHLGAVIFSHVSCIYLQNRQSLFAVALLYFSELADAVLDGSAPSSTQSVHPFLIDLASSRFHSLLPSVPPPSFSASFCPPALSHERRAAILAVLQPWVLEAARAFLDPAVNLSIGVRELHLGNYAEDVLLNVVGVANVAPFLRACILQ